MLEPKQPGMHPNPSTRASKVCIKTTTSDHSSLVIIPFPQARAVLWHGMVRGLV